MFLRNQSSKVLTFCTPGCECTGELDGISIPANVELKSAKGMDEVDKSDHLFVIADFNRTKFGEPNGGINQIGGKKVAFINSKLFKGPWDSTVGTRAERTAAHEFGHMLGWENTGGIMNFFNIMISGGFGSGLNTDQKKSIIGKETLPKKYWRLNLGSNSSFNGLRPNVGGQRGIIRF